MNFNDRYEHIQIGFRDNKVGIIRGLNENYCSQCKKKTYWMDMKTGKNLCSEECLAKFEKDKMNTSF